MPTFDAEIDLTSYFRDKNVASEMVLRFNLLENDKNRILLSSTISLKIPYVIAL